MYIRWHGHACFEIGDGAVLLTDPHDGKSIGIHPPSLHAPDIITVSHDHFDHNATRPVSGPGTKIFGGSNPTSGEHEGVRIRGIGTFHDDCDGDKRGSNTAFVMDFGELTLCHLGDLGHVIRRETALGMGDVDILFVPVGGNFTLDAEGAWDVIDIVRPRVAIPMHYKVGGLSLPISPAEEFLRDAREVERVGNEVDFEPADLPNEPVAVWMFSL